MYESEQIQAICHRTGGRTPYLEVLKAIADYQFGIGIGNCLFDQDSFRIQRSVNTWRIRNVLSKDGLFLVLRPQDGLFSLTINAGRRLKECAPFPSLRVMVRKEVEDAILKEGMFSLNTWRTWTGS